MTPSVVYLLGAYPRWSETFLRRDLAALLGAGLPLRPVALFPGDTPTEAGWPMVPLLRAAAASPSGGAGPRLRLPLPARLRTSLSLWSHRRLRADLASFARREQAVHLHAEFAELPALLGGAVAADLGISCSVGVHARDVHQPKFHLETLLGRCRFVTACNQAARDAVLAACPALAERLHLLPHGVEVQQWPYRAPPLRLHPELCLFFAGRFVEKKGIDTLLRALAILVRRGRPVALSLAGDGPLDAPLRALARGLGVDAAVTWMGVLSHAAVRAALQAADALVVPSRISRDGDRDGVPNIVLEAMASGVPVIGTTVGGLGEVLSACTGWPVAADRAGELAAVLDAFAQGDSETECRRQAARRLVEKNYDAVRLASARADLFRRVLGTPSSAA